MTRNEEQRVAHALASVPRGASILVLDAQSSDGTAKLARAAGARVVVRPWAGFVDARRHAQSLVQTPWTFMLDADERLDDELRVAVGAAPADGPLGFSVRRVTYFCGRAMRGAGWGNERMLRLFRTSDARLVASPAAGGTADLHERWLVDGEVAFLPGTLHHDSYPTLASYRERFGRYTSLEARGVRGSALGTATALLRALVRLPWLFFVRGGWRDGWRGAYVCAGSAFYSVAVAVKAAASH